MLTARPGAAWPCTNTNAPSLAGETILADFTRPPPPPPLPEHGRVAETRNSKANCQGQSLESYF